MQLQRLLCGSARRSCPAGTILFEEGQAPTCLHILLSGVVELFSTCGPRDYGILILAPGDLFMPAASLFGEPYLNSARVLGRSKLLMLDTKVVRAEAAASTELALRMARALAGQFRMAVRHIIDLKCRSAPQRLALFLLRLADQSGTAAGAELPIPKRSLAARVGMTAETLSRTLQTLAENGLHVRGNRIIVRDRQRIDAFCGPRIYPDAADGSLDVYAL